MGDGGFVRSKASSRLSATILSTKDNQHPPPAMLIITHDVRFVRMLARFRSLRVFTVSNDQRFEDNPLGYVLNSGRHGEGYTIDEVHTRPPDLFTADFFGVAN